MPNHKTGRMVDCPICGAEYYRSRSDIETYNKRQTCGSSECKRANRSGKNNPFWGRSHSPESRQKMRANLAANPRKGTGPKKGIFKHSAEAKRRIALASKRLWQEKREHMLASLPRGADHHFCKPPELRRHRKQFSPTQRRHWTSGKCAYCESANYLELDHIIPIFDGGTNVRENAQTLCRGCNLWKTYFVDLPRYYAARATMGL